MAIRVCMPQNFKRLLEYDAVQEKFRGYMSNVANSIMGDVTRILNMTIDIQADNLGVGEYKEDLKRFDGCLGELQMNRSDVILQMNPYPLDIENISQGLIAYETSLVFVSTYSKTEIAGKAQVLKSFEVFPPDIWSLCVVTWFNMALFLMIEELAFRWLRGPQNVKFTNHLYQVLIHCTQVGSMDDGGLTKRLMFMTASLFSLLLLNYFCNMMSTDLVVIKDPLVFHTYNDVIERKAIPLFIKGMSYNALFNEPGALKIRKKLWDYAVHSYGEKRLTVELSSFLFLVMALSVVKQKAIVVLDEALMPVVGVSGCSLAGRDVTRIPSLTKLLKQQERVKRLMQVAGIDQHEQDVFLEYARLNDLRVPSPPEILVHISRDPEEQPYNQGVVYTAQNKKLQQLILGGIREVIEHGLHFLQLKECGEVDLFKENSAVESLLGPPIRSRRSAVQTCLSKSIVKPPVEVDAVTAENLTTLFILLGTVYSALFLLLLAEIAFKKLFDKTASSTALEDDEFVARENVQMPHFRLNGRPIRGSSKSRSAWRVD